MRLGTLINIFASLYFGGAILKWGLMGFPIVGR